MLKLLEKVSNAIARQGAELNQDSALFIINKWDLVDVSDGQKREMEHQVLIKLRQAWSFVKPENMYHTKVKLVNKTDNSVICDERNMIVKISDVGISRYSQQQITQGHKIGTTPYKAPEIASNRPGFHSRASDVYSLGLVLWELWYCDLVYEKFNTDHGEIPKLKPRDPMNKTLRSLIENCLQSSPNARLSITEVVDIAMKITVEQHASPLK